MRKYPFCKKCSLSDNTISICTWGEGPIPCEVMLVGLALGATENKYSGVLQGRAGEEFDKVLQFFELNRNELYISNLLKCLGPPINTIHKSHINACLPYLKEEIEEVKPKFILTLGAEAFKTLTGKEEVTKYIGKLFPLKWDSTILVAPAIHPAAILHRSEDSEFRYKAFLKSFLILRKWIDKQIIDPADYGSYNINPTEKQLFQLFARIKEEKHCTLDMETNSLRIFTNSFQNNCCGITLNEREATSFNWHTASPSIKNLVKEILLDPSITINGHNIKYDLHCLEKEFKINSKCNISDTILLHYLLYDHKPHNLSSLAWDYTKMGGYDAEVVEAGGAHNLPIGDKLFFYNACDVDVTERIKNTLLPMVIKDGTYNVYKHLLLPATRTLLRMEQRGVLADKDYLIKLYDEIDSTRKKMLQQLHEYPSIRTILRKERYTEFNPNSNPQMLNLAKILKISTFKKTKKGNPSIDADVLNFFASYHPELKLIKDWRSLSNIQSHIENDNDNKDTFLSAIQDDGKIHTSYNLFIARSGRSCLAQGTLIDTVRDVSKYPQGIPIEQIKIGDMVYSFDNNGNLCIKKVIWSGKTGTKKVIRLYWKGTGQQHSGYLDLTPEHKVRLLDGSWKEAKDLQIADHICALHRGYSNGYTRLWASGQDEISREHRFIYEQLVAPVLPMEIVHHKDHNPANNTVSNLVKLTSFNHHSYHAQYRLQTEPSRRKFLGDVLRANRAHVQVRRGKQHPEYLSFTRTQLLRLLAKAKGCPTKTCHDYETIINKLKEHGIDWRNIQKRYNSDGVYLSKGVIQKTIHLPQRDRLRKLKVGYYRWKELCIFYHLIPYNHYIYKIEVLPTLVDVYNLEVEDTHNFIANELCVSNSSSKPNLQNIPVRIMEEWPQFNVRNFLVAEPDHVFLSADYSLHELRVAAAVSKDRYLASLLISGKDPHSAMVAEMTHTSYEEAVERYKQGDAIAKGLRVDAKCFHPMTEVLTPNGWIKLKDLKGEPIIQAIPRKNRKGIDLEWTTTYKLRFDPNHFDYLLHLKNEGIDLQVTPDHKMLVQWNNNSPFTTVLPEKLSYVRHWWNAGELNGTLIIDDKYLRLAIATQADGSYKGNCIHFGFSKQRKIDRLLSLLNGINYTTSCYTKYGVTNISIQQEDANKIKRLLDKDKTFPWWWLQLNTELRSIVLEECRFWDGTKQENWRMYKYFSSIQKNIDVLQAIASITNKKTKIGITYQGCHSLSIKGQPKTRGGNVSITKIPYIDKVAVLSVPSTFVLVRDGGIPIITQQSINFGVIFGLGYTRLSYSLRKTKDEAKKLLLLHKILHPDYYIWKKEIEDFMEREKYAPLITGRKRRFSVIDNEAKRQGINACIQGPASDILLMALIRLDEYFTQNKLRSFPVLAIHDEVILMVHKAELQRVREEIEPILIKPPGFNLSWLGDIPLKVDFAIGERLGELKDYR